MCRSRNSKRVRLTSPKPIRVDSCMKNLIEIMRMKGIETLACCCGHDKYPMTIVIRRYGMIEELISGRYIPRKKRFYLKDKKGYYYIPEVNEPR